MRRTRSQAVSACLQANGLVKVKKKFLVVLAIWRWVALAAGAVHA
jgi:hypothetical protein